MGDRAILAENVVKRFGDVAAVDGVSFAVAPGEVYGFLPITYLLEPMRATLNAGWDGPALLRGLAVGLLMLAVLFAVALYGLGARTRRR